MVAMWNYIGRRHPKSGAPIYAVVVCCIAYTACLGLGFARLVEIDVLLYGLSLLLEFATLVALRVREPDLGRPFRVPGGLVGAVLLGVLPMALLLVALVQARSEEAGAINALTLGAIIVAAGPILYVMRRSAMTGKQPPPRPEKP